MPSPITLPPPHFRGPPRHARRQLPGQPVSMRLMTPTGTRVLLVDEDAQRGAQTTRVLEGHGYCVAATLDSAERIGEALRAGDLEVILVHASVHDGLLSALHELPVQLRRPTVLLSEDGAAESIHRAVAAGVNAYVVIGAAGNRIRSAIDLARANFANTSVLREELDEAQTALRERKVVERAKGIIMREKGLDEAQAYALMRRQAMHKNLRLVQIATTINEAAEVMNG